MIKIPSDSILDEALVCTHTRSTLETTHLVYTLVDGSEVEITGPVSGFAVYKVVVYSEGEIVSITERVGPAQLLSHLERAAENKNT